MTFSVDNEKIKMTIPSSWTQFLPGETSSKRISSLHSIREMIAIGLMLEHLHRWFLVQPEPNDLIWVETANYSPMFVTMIGSLSTPTVKTSDGLFYFPKIQWSSNPKVTDLPTSSLVLRMLSQCTKELQAFIYSLHPEWTWMNYLDRPSAILLNTVLSLKEFLESFSSEMESLPSLFEYTSDQGEIYNLRDQLQNQLQKTFPILPTGIAPPMNIPYDASLPFLTQLSDDETKLITTAYQFEVYTQSMLSPEFTKSATYAKHLQLLRRYFKSRDPRSVKGTATLHQLYKAFYSSQESWIEYTLPERLSIEDDTKLRVPMKLRDYIVPEPNYNRTCVKPVFSNPSLSSIKTMEWNYRQWIFRCILAITLIANQEQSNEMSILVEIDEDGEKTIRQPLLHLLCGMFPLFSFYFFGLETEKASPSNCHIRRDKLTESSAKKWLQEHPQRLVIVITSVKEVYKIISSSSEGNWGVLPFKIDSSNPVQSNWDGSIFYTCWGGLMDRESILITNKREIKEYNSKWLEQHLNWNNVVRRNELQSRSNYPSNVNVQWDTVYEYNILETYLTLQGNNSERSIVERMKEISIASGNLDKYQQKYCFEIGYRPSPIIQKRWHEIVKPTDLKTIPNVVMQIYKQLIWKIPLELRERWEKTYEKDIVKIIKTWERTRQLEMAEICGMYCYDHVKYQLLRDWLKSNHLLKRQEGVSKEHLEARFNARVREIQALGTQARSKNDTGFLPCSLLDFGGDKGGVASRLATLYNLSPGMAIVSDVPEWYGHKRERLFNNVTFQTLHSHYLPFTDGQFDTVLSLMVLHHINQVEITCKELRRVLKPGGLLFLREHDCENEDDSRLIDIEHSLFELVLSHKSKQETIEYLANYDAEYRSLKIWTQMLSVAGFKELNLKYESPDGYTKYAYRVYEAI
jgi:ubiquinone/menaquinone biosynthesis C-methylase UbiE